MHGTSAKNTALDVKVKCQKEVAKLTPEIMKIRLGERVLGRQNQDPKKDTKLNKQKGKILGGGGPGSLAPGAELLGDDKVID
mgnify:CR=1 FL=1